MPDKQITIIHPSRQRAQLAYESATQWLNSAGMEVEYILSIDIDDPQAHIYENGFWEDRIIVKRANSSAVDAINNAAKVATGDIMIVISDDWLLPQNWAVDILKASEGKTDWIMKTPDGGTQSWMITLPILDRAYYNRFGYIYFPEYLHMFADTDLTAVADLTGRKITAPIAFQHKHYSTVGGIPKDDVSIKADKTWGQGEALFLRRYKQNFGLVDPPGKITSPEYLNWIRANIHKAQ